MKGKILILIVAIIGLLLTGCFEVNSLIEVKKDGSGTLEQTFLFGQAMMQQTQMFAEGLSESFGEDEDSSDSSDSEHSYYDVEKLKNDAQKYGEGVTYVSSKMIEKDDKVGYSVIYAFKDINKLKIEDNPMGGDIPMSPMMGDEPESQKQYINFEFKKGITSVLKINMPKDVDDGQHEVYEEYEDDVEYEDEKEFDENDPMAEAMMNMMKEMYKGMRFSYKIKFDGKVVKTNASHHDGSEVTIYEIDFEELSKDPKGLKKLSQNQNPSPDEIKDLMKSIPGVKVEINDEIEVKFK